jgi:hypothetical protein
VFRRLTEHDFKMFFGFLTRVLQIDFKMFFGFLKKILKIFIYIYVYMRAFIEAYFLLISTDVSQEYVQLPLTFSSVAAVAQMG